MKEIHYSGIKVHFHACFLPNQKEFNVTVKPEKGNRLFEKMTIAKFLRFARDNTKPMKVDGTTIQFDGSGAKDIEQKIRDYFKSVADAYVQAKYKENIRNN